MGMEVIRLDDHEEEPMNEYQELHLILTAYPMTESPRSA